MRQLLRTTLKILGAIAALLLVLVVAVLFMADPDQYRPSIEDAVFKATGLNLNIAGEMSLSYRPYVGVVLNDVRLLNPDRPQELLSASQVTLRVDPRELIGGRLVIEELHADGFHFNWFVDAEGNSWWMTDRLLEASRSGRDASDQESDVIETLFNFISISNGSADLQDLRHGYLYSVRNLELSSQNSNVTGRPFPVQTTFELIDPTAPAPWPITVSSSNRLALESGEVEITDFQLALTPALLQGTVQIDNLFGDYSWQAQLATNQFALDDLLDNLLARPDLSQAAGLPGFSTDRIWQTEFQIQLSGDADGVEVPESGMRLGDMQLDMAATLRFANSLIPTNLNFEIETNNLDLSPYVSTANPPQTLPITEDRTFAIEPEERTLFDLEIPENLWSDMNVQGTVSIDSLFVSGVQFGSISLFANVESGVLDLELQPTNVLNGSVEGNFRINSRPSLSEVTMELFTDQIDVADLTLPFITPGAIGGRLDLESRYSGTGSTLGQWMASFGGASSFTITDNSVDIGIIKQVFTAIAALSPTGEAIQQWPDDIRFNEFNGYAIFDQGLDENQQIKLRLDNFDVSGTGGVDVAAGSFHYDLLFTVLGAPFPQTIPINERYHDLPWPVRCNARFDDPVNQYCRPDLAQVREIFTQLGNNALPDNRDEVLPDQAPEELQDTTRDLWRSLFRIQD